MLVGCAAPVQEWAKPRTPSAGQEQAIGGYTMGCLAGGVALADSGEGFEVVRPSRNRHFGHPMMIDYITGLGKKLTPQDGKLIVGDIAQPRGGPMPSGHASHQTGLDVDIWYWQPESGSSLPEQEKLRPVSVSMVVAGGKKVDTKRWMSIMHDKLKAAAEFTEVDRIFVNPAIKKALCERDAGAVWLHKIRPWWGHDSHFHVRLHCPVGDSACVPQGELSPGDGCDETLNWWFSTKPSQSRAKMEIRERATQLTRMPAACALLLRDG